MKAYPSVVYYKMLLSNYLHYTDAALPPEQLESHVRALKGVQRFQEFMERLSSSSRKRLSDTIEERFRRREGGMFEIIKKIQEECYSMLELEEEAVSSSSSKIIGIRDEMSKLKEALIDDYNIGHTIFLLAGMAGIGKTFLAREIFEDLIISECFPCRVWVTLGNEKKSEEVMEAILAQVEADELNNMPIGGDKEEEKMERLKNSLQTKRCLIVVDDVWDHHDFRKKMDKVLQMTQTCGYTMRFLLTTRIKDGQTSGRWYHFAGACFVFDKRLLNEEESWDLLREKAFAGGLCPPRLEDAGKKIADKCDGLPLTILNVADRLSNVEESVWIDVAEKKKHQLFIDVYDQISKVLYPSYKNLRDDLKLAFLYMGVFPLKYKIHRSKLFNLWAAEEIFYPTDKLFLDSVLSKFDDCSLIMVCQRAITIRICRLHSSWWELCQREARKTNFFYVLDSYKDGLKEDIKSQTRLSMHNNVLFALEDVHKSIEENCASIVESLLCFGPYNQYMVPMCYGLKLLQRLDALNIRFYDFPLEVLELAKLMYLALTCNGRLPHSISKLEKLQYLMVHPHLSIKPSGDPSYMPMEIWDLEELKHLQVMGKDLPDSGDKSLKKLSTLLDVSTASCTVLNRLPNLEKLRIRIEVAPEAQDPLCCFDGISSLEKLKALTCIFVNPEFKFQLVRSVASFPVLPILLTKLSLSGLGYAWKEMKRIASSLSHLEVLKLQFNAFQGHIWELGERDFQSLQFLLMEDLDLVKLMGGSENFKSLQHLSIKHCYKFEEIHMTNHRKISRIEIVDSNPLIEKSIKQLLFETDYFMFNLIVNSSWKSERAATWTTSASFPED